MAISEKIVISVVDKFTSGFQNADKNVNKLNKSLQNTSNYSKLALNGLAAMGAVATSALGAAYAAASNWIGAVNDLSKKTGMATESASKLLGVAQSVGLSGEEMSAAMMKMSKSAETAYVTLQKANAEGKASTDIYTKWGIAITDADGNMLSAEAILNNVISKHREMANGVQKSAMEMELFGKSGGNLNTMLDQTDEQLQKTIDNLRRSGLIIDAQTSQTYKKFNQELNQAKLSMQGLAVSVGVQLLPQLESLADSVTSAVQKYGALDDSTKSLITTTLEVVAGVSAFSVGMRTAIFVMGPLATAIGELITKLLSLKATYDAVAISKAAALGGVGVVATVAAAAAYKGYADYQNYQKGGTMTYDDTGNVHILAPGESAGSDQTSVGSSIAATSVADFKKSEDKFSETTKNATTIFEKLGNQVGNVGTVATDTGKKLAAASSAAVTKPLVNNAVDAMRSLEGVEKYVIEGGTGCMDACSKALLKIGASEKLFAQNAYGNGALNVQAFAANASQYGMLHANNGSYQRQAGDIALYGTGGIGSLHHAAMVTENGGTIQNGESHGTVYESDRSPESQGTVAYYVSTSQLTNKVTAGSAAISGQDLANAAINKKAEAISGIRNMIKDIDSEVLNIGSDKETDKILAEAADKIQEINDQISKAKEAGVDTADLEAASTRYLDAMKTNYEKAQREETDDVYNMEISHIQRMTDLQEGYTKDMNRELGIRLADYRTWLESVVNDESLSVEERMDRERELAEVMTQQNEIAATSIDTAWSVASQKIKNTTVNYADMMTSTVDNITESISNGLKDFIGSSESVGDRLIGIVKDVANSVLNAIIQMTVQQTVLTPLSNALGGLFGKFGTMNSSGGGLSGLGSLAFSAIGGMSGGSTGVTGLGNYSFTPTVSFAASGGTRTGLTVVGERGPELIDFRNPGRVYNNEELSSAMGGGGGSSVNLTMNISTPDATSFKRSRAQTASMMAGIVRKGNR